MSVAHRPYVIGVTGKIGCGKSAVLAALRDLGAETIDADQVYAGLVTPGSPLLQSMAARFGPGVIACNGGLGRRYLRDIVFDDPAALQQLDAITHPAVVAAILARIGASDAPVVAFDAIKLFESGLDQAANETWRVTCRLDEQVTRIMERDHIGFAEAMARVRVQDNMQTDRPVDFEVDNSGTVDETVAQVQQRWIELVAKGIVAPGAAKG